MGLIWLVKTLRTLSFIDISYEEEGKPVTLKGIYRVDNGELTLCWDVPGRERPKEFKSEPKSTVQVIVFRRAGRD